jgi:hypothetical protein
MEVANRFADGEDAYNNKRGRSLEVDKTSRQRLRYRNGDDGVVMMVPENLLALMSR